MAWFGPPDVDKLQARRDIPGLVKALNYQKDAEIQKAAVHALWKIGHHDERAEMALAAALEHPDPFVRKEVCYWLKYRNFSHAVEPLIEVLKDSDPNVRVEAATAFQSYKDTRVIGPLIAALKDSDPKVRAEAARVLGEQKDARAVEPLMAALKDPDPEVRLKAAQALEGLRDARSVEALLLALKDASFEVRRRAVYALHSLGDARADQALIDALHDATDAVRLAALDVHKQRKDPRAFEALTALLQDTNHDVRRNAVIALGEQRDRRPIGPLIAALKDQDVNVRVQAFEALAKFGEACIEPLTAALDRGDVPNLKMVMIGASREKLALMYSLLNTDALDLDDLIEMAFLLKNNKFVPDKKINLNNLVQKLVARRRSSGAPQFQMSVGDDDMAVRTYNNPESMQLLNLLEYIHQVKLPPNPFVFRNGQQAQRIADLVSLCQQAPEDAIYHLMAGHFDPWLAYMGRKDLAERTRRIRESTEDDETRLKHFLSALE